jgi:hypothetical protein
MVQRALQLVQNAIGYRPKVMVTRADPHSGQRGMTTSLVVSLVEVSTSRTAAGASSELVLKAA